MPAGRRRRRPYQGPRWLRRSLRELAFSQADWGNMIRETATEMIEKGGRPMSGPSYMSTKKLVRVCMIAFVVASGGGVVAAQYQIEGEPQASEVERPAIPGMGPQAIVREDLGPSPNPVDVWSLQCGLGTVSARADVGDLGGVDGVRLYVTIVNPLGRAATQRAPDNGRSPLATLNTGPGNYLVIIGKSFMFDPPPPPFLTPEPYDSLQICQDAQGNLTRESVQLVQDQ